MRTIKNIFDDIRNEDILIKQFYEVDKIKSLLKPYLSHIMVYEGMGSFTIIRRKNIDSKLEGLFVHSDDFYTNDKTEIIKKFIKNSEEVIIEPTMYHEWLGAD